MAHGCEVDGVWIWVVKQKIAVHVKHNVFNSLNQGLLVADTKTYFDSIYGRPYYITSDTSVQRFPSLFTTSVYYCFKRWRNSG